MKICSKCGRELEESEFYRKRPNGKEYLHCKLCQNEYGRQHYNRNKQQYIGKATRRTARIYNDVIRPAKSKPCTDCGNSFPVACMDFDHARGEKSFNIAGSNSHVSMKRLEEEIAKCDVVCSNCHRIRTAKRISDGSIV